MRKIYLALSCVLLTGCAFTDWLSPWGDELEDELAVDVEFIVYETANGPALGTTINATNTGSEAISAFAKGGCAWWLRAYSTSDLDDAPVWRHETVRGACLDMLVPVDIAPGETKSFSPGDFLVADILGSDLQPGTYHFTVQLNLRRPELTAEFPAGAVKLPDPR